jgi:hypothetical protein
LVVVVVVVVVVGTDITLLLLFLFSPIFFASLIFTDYSMPFPTLYHASHWQCCVSNWIVVGYVVGEFRMDLQALFSVYNGGGQTVENYNLRRTSLTRDT